MLYESIPQYIETVSSLEDRINRLDAILTQMENSMLMVAANPGEGVSGQPGIDLTEEYSLDDGQTKIRTKYRDVAAFIASYKQIMNIRNMIIARLNNNISGSIIRLRDSRNFTGCQ